MSADDNSKEEVRKQKKQQEEEKRERILSQILTSEAKERCKDFFHFI